MIKIFIKISPKHQHLSSCGNITRKHENYFNKKQMSVLEDFKKTGFSLKDWQACLGNSVVLETLAIKGFPCRAWVSFMSEWITSNYSSTQHITVGAQLLFWGDYHLLLTELYFSLEVEFRDCFVHGNSFIPFRNKLLTLRFHPWTSLCFINGCKCHPSTML